MSHSLGIRHLGREVALQLLFALEFAGPNNAYAEVEQLFLDASRLHRRGWGTFARKLVENVRDHQAALDEVIRPTLKNWTLERLPIVDRLCLRMALCELTYFADIPLRVTLNEYIELSRSFGDDESPVYINAVLDRLARAFPHKDFQVSEEEDPDPSAQADNASLNAPNPPAEE